MRLSGIALAIAICATTSARASDAGDARQHFDRAQTHFAVGEFAAAGDDYLAAYKLKPDPALLYDAAQSYRLAGNADKALVLYKNYVQFYPSQPNVEEVQRQITKLKEAIAATEKAKTAPPTDTAAPKPLPQGEHETAAPAPPAVAAAVVAAPPPKPLVKKSWFWGVIAGSAVVVGGAIALGVVFGRPLHDPNPTLGALQVSN